MQPAMVEPVDVFEDSELHLGAGLPHTVFDQLRFERVDKDSAIALSYASPTDPTDASTW